MPCSAPLAAGDIGTHFPDTDPRHRGADSAVLLAEIAGSRALRGHRIGNVDVTILAERPKLAPHVGAMRERLAELLAVDVERVSVKAKTMEGLGAIGEGEAIAALAVVLLEPAPSKPRRAQPPRRRSVRQGRLKKSTIHG